MGKALVQWNFRWTTLFVVVVMLFTACAKKSDGSNVPKDKDLAGYLAGTWVSKEIEKNATIESETTYHKDGTFIGKCRVSGVGGEIRMEVKGEWFVKGVEIHTKVTNTDNLLISVGDKFVDTVLAISEVEMRYKDEEGEVMTEFRKKE